jgi:dCMP deaminase
LTKQEIWDRRFLDLADLVATWSKDPKRKVGAVIVDSNNRIISVGFNGFARGVDDSPISYEDTGFKLQSILHAETNAIMFAQGNTRGCTIYTSCPTCVHCASQIIQSGITRVVYVALDTESKWVESNKIASNLYKQTKVKEHVYSFRQETK